MRHYGAVSVGIVVTVLGVSLLASVAQSLTGFGFGLIVVPFLVLVLDVKDAVVISSVLGLANVALLSLRVWRSVPWRTVTWLLVGSFAGMPLGLAVLVLAPQEALRLAVGVAAIVMAAALATGLRLEARGAPSEVAVGVTSGILRTSTSMSGPPVVLYLQGRGHPPQEFRGALTMYFLIGSLVSIGAFFGAEVVTGRALALTAAALPSVYVGSWAGDRLLRRVDAALFRRIVLLLLVATALSGVGSSIQRLLS